MSEERLQKILSRAGISSRRQAEQLIREGKVRVNGRVVKTLGSRADLILDEISVNGKTIPKIENHRFLAYYKPRGLVVSKNDELGRETIFDRLGLPNSFNTAGRLDKESEGLLLLSNDGRWIQRYSHPSYQVSKIYHVQISKKIPGSELTRLQKGIVVDNKTLRAHRVRVLSRRSGDWLEIELREGVKREIRLMLKELGVQVRRLIRIQHGSVKLGRMKPGEVRELPKQPG